MRINNPISHIDTLPTVLDLLGRKECCGQQGESLTGYFTGKRKPSDVFIEWNTSGTGDEDSGPSARTVITPDGYKLVLHDKDKNILFHRAKDPLELANLYNRPEHASKTKELKSKIDTWQKRNKDKLELPV